MPSYDDQLAAYRAQLANISSMQAQSAAHVPGTGAMATTGLAFNTMMGDMSRMASYVSTFSATPSASSVQLMGQSQPSMGFGQAVGGVIGLSTPQSPMYLADYQYLANERFSRGIGTTAMKIGNEALGIGAGLIGGGIGAAIGSPLGPPGMLVGGLIGGLVGSAAASPIGRGASSIASASQELQLATPAIFGGMGMSREASRVMARDIYRQAIAGSEEKFGGSGEGMALANLAITQGTKFGLFSGVGDTDSFKKELGELTTTIKEMSRAIRVSKEEMIPLLAEMKQGGFYGAHAGGQAITAGSGLAYGAGVGFREMHETGLRGAAMFRGTGIPVGMGYTIGEQNLFNVRKMAQSGALSQETINQLGGVGGTAETFTAGTAGFMQGPLGRASQAMFMKGRGEINEEALESFLGGANPADIMARSNPNPALLANTMNRQRYLEKLGPERMQMMQVAWMNNTADIYQKQMGLGAEDAFALSFRNMSPSMGINPNAMPAYWAMSQNLPALMDAQKANVKEERRRLAEDKIAREGDLWGALGTRRAGNWMQRNVVGPSSERWAAVGESISDDARAVGDFFGGVRRVDEHAGALTRAYEVLGDDPLRGVERGRGTLSRADKDLMSKLGMMDNAPGKTGYVFEPTGIEKTVRVGKAMTTHGWSEIWNRGDNASGTSEESYNLYMKKVEGVKAGVATKATKEDDKLVEFFQGTGGSSVAFSSKFANDLELAAKGGVVSRTDMQKQTLDLVAQAKSKARETLGVDYSDQEVTRALVRAYGGKDLKSNIATVFEETGTSSAGFDLEGIAKKKEALLKEASFNVMQAPPKGIFGASPDVELYDKMMSDPDVRKVLLEYSDPENKTKTGLGDVEDVLKSKGYPLEGLKGLKEKMDNKDTRAKMHSTLKALEQVVATGDAAKFNVDIVRPKYKSILKDVPPAKELKDNLLSKAISTVADDKFKGDSAKEIGHAVFVSSTEDLAALNQGEIRSDVTRWRKQATAIARKAGRDTATEEDMVKAVRMWEGSLQTKRSGTESTSASDRVQARAMSEQLPKDVLKLTEAVNMTSKNVERATAALDKVLKK